MANGGDRFLLGAAQSLQFDTSFTARLLTQPTARSHNNNNDLQLAFKRIDAHCGSAYSVPLQGDFYWLSFVAVLESFLCRILGEFE